MARSSAETRTRLLEAAEHLLVREGPSAVGVNAVAAEAGVDKVLIYRYFGGLPQLLACLSSERRLWPSMEDRAATERSLESALRLALISLARDLRADALVRRASAWELTDDNAMTSALSGARERETARLLASLRSRFDTPRYLDTQALLALLASGVAYLATRPAHAPLAFGLDTSSDEDWQRIQKMTSSIIRLLAGSV